MLLEFSTLDKLFNSSARVRCETKNDLKDVLSTTQI